MSGTLGLIGVPSSAGGHGAGCETGPAHLRRFGIGASLQAGGLPLTDYGDLPTVTFRPDPEHPFEQSRDIVRGVIDSVAHAVRPIARKGQTPIVLGGDCTITIGVLAALVTDHPNIGMVYLDGDLDLNTPDVTPSGYFDGMGLAHIIGDGSTALSRAGARFPLLAEDRIAAFGFNESAGGIDPYELRRLARSAIRKFPVADVRRDPGGSARKALDELDPFDSLLVHLDVDVIDDRDMPAVDVRHRHSLRLHDLAEALKIFVAHPHWAGLVICEFNATLDPHGEAAATLIGTLRSVFSLD